MSLYSQKINITLLHQLKKVISIFYGSTRRRKRAHIKLLRQTMGDIEVKVCSHIGMNITKVNFKKLIQN